MSLVCDSCGADVERTRPVAFVPLANGGGVDLCEDCSEALSLLSIDVSQSDAVYPNEER